MASRPAFPLPRLDALRLGAHRVLALTDQGLYAACGVRIAFTGRDGGVSEGEFASLNCGMGSGDDREAVQRNRQIVCEAIGAGGAPLVVPSQVHGTEVVRVSDAGDVPRAAERAAQGSDALVVEPAGVAALLSFADCLPLVLVAESERFAVVHAGWRGAVAHIARIAAAELAASGDDPAGFNAYIGPHIRSECFEVSPDLAECFADEFGRSCVPDSRHVSLARAVTADLLAAGLDRSRIADAGICTKCHPDRYFSYRATGGRCGRHAAAAFRHAVRTARVE